MIRYYKNNFSDGFRQVRLKAPYRWASVYSQQVFLDKFTFSCVRSISFPWQDYLLVCTVNKFSLTSLLSRVYSQQVSLDKITFSCVQSTSFPWQVYLLVCTVNKFSLTSFRCSCTRSVVKHLSHVSLIYLTIQYKAFGKLGNIVAETLWFAMFPQVFLCSQVRFLLRKHCFLVFAHLGKYGETLARNNVSATMFPSLPTA
jgi:hypothetical protein